jgi:hypothetical protein
MNRSRAMQGEYAQFSGMPGVRSQDNIEWQVVKIGR